MNTKSLILGSLICTSLNISATAANLNSFNPDINLTLDGRNGSFSNTSDYELPGFMLGGEAGRGEQGLHLGHSELSLSSNIDDLFYGKFTTAIAEHEGATEVEIEEAFIEAQALGNGFGFKAGRFFSDIGYLNNQHGHAWDFTDAPLVYRALLGNQLVDDGLQFSWLAPTDLYFKIGAEALRGERFPAGGATNNGQGAYTLFAKLGGDIGFSNAWQLGFSHWHADVENRASGTHSHGAVAATEIPIYTGVSQINAIDFVWKWSPNGNSRERNLTIQAEYFQRDENGTVELVDNDPLTPQEITSYQGKQTGWYLQGVYQFMPRWRVGLRYDRLNANNTGSDPVLLGEASLDNEGHTPERRTIMFDYSRSEFTRVRFQYAVDNSYEDSDQLFFVQYIVTLGVHGAHQF